ncbi:hypothetical protein H6F32_06750 [Anabaena sp. FACHB-1237]|nr:hypothetical protein [Anabaena sp. FACHB-1237]
MVGMILNSFSLFLITPYVTWSWPSNLCIFIFLLCAGLLGLFYSWVSAFVYIGFVIIHLLISFVYVAIHEELSKSFKKWHQEIMILCTSWLGIFLGWLIYQIFPIFTNR